MLVNILKIKNDTGASLSFSFEQNIDKPQEPQIFKFLSPVKVEGTITNVDDVYKAEAHGRVTVEMTCCRCLKGVAVDVPIEVNENFSVTGSEEETETFLGDTIDLSSVVGRSILIGLPMKVTCDDGCKGLCPVCGKDLNEGDCNCTPSNIDPRFESLRSLFKLDEEV